MQTTLRRLAVIAMAAAALCALVLPSANAASAPTATTNAATNVSGSTALLNGQIDTAGQPVQWEFAYGTTTAYANHTALKMLPGSSGPQSVSAVITGLSPGTTYHFQLLVAPAAGSGYGTVIGGGDKTFKTFSSGKAGSLRLRSGKLFVKHGKVTVPLRCASSRSCKGKLTIKHGSTRCVGGKRFSLGAGASKKVKAGVSTKCNRLLRRARSHKISASLRVSLSSGQPNLSRGVKLIRR
jgi:hypothetical protein